MVSLGSSNSNGSSGASPRTREIEELRRIYGDQVNTSSPSKCYCSSKVRTEVFWGQPDPGRRFVACPKLEEQGCGFFLWIDPSFPYQATKVISDLLEIKRNLNDSIMAMQRTVENKDAELERLREQCLEGKDVADYLAGINVEQQREITTTLEEKRKLMKRLNYHNAFTAMLLSIFAAFIWAMK